MADARPEPRRPRYKRQARRVEPAQAIERARRERVAIEVADRAGEIADLVVEAQEAGLFLAGRAVAQKLHGDRLAVRGERRRARWGSRRSGKGNRRRRGR